MLFIMCPCFLLNTMLTCAAQVPASSTSMDTDEASTSTSTPKAELSPSSLPEVEMYAYVLVLMFLCDHKHWELVRTCCASSTPLAVPPIH